MCGIADHDDSALVPAVQRDPLNRRAVQWIFDPQAVRYPGTSPPKSAKRS
jgi:hypothetical protein